MVRPEDKFKIERPRPDELVQLGALVDEIENLTHQKSPLALEKLKELNSRLSNPTDLREICSYFGAVSRDDYLLSHLTPDPYQHQNLSDDELIWLIRQIQENPIDESVISYYPKIVDINTSSPSGSTLTACETDKTPVEILEELKRNRDDVFHL